MTNTETREKRTSVEPTRRADVEPSRLRRALGSTPMYVFLVDVGLIFLFSILSPGHAFWSLQNAQSVLGDGAQSLMLAAGATMLLAAGQFDLSIGANLVLCSVVGGLFVASRADGGQDLTPLMWVTTIVICVATGMVVGLVNGALISFLRLNSLIATLGMLGICSGVAFVLSQGSDVTGIPQGMQSEFGLRNVAGLPMPFWIALLITTVLGISLRFGRFGLRTLAIGSNRSAADRAGIGVGVHVLALTVILGGIAGLAGFIEITRFGTTNTAGHSLDALTALTAAVVGGTRLTGGRASMLGTVFGSLLAYVLLSGLLIIGLPPFYELIANGAVLIVAVAIDGLRTRTTPR